MGEILLSNINVGVKLKVDFYCDTCNCMMEKVSDIKFRCPKCRGEVEEEQLNPYEA